MKLTGIKVTPVTVPMEAPLRWSMGVEVAATRAIIEVSLPMKELPSVERLMVAMRLSMLMKWPNPIFSAWIRLEIGVLSHRLGVFFALAMKRRCHSGASRNRKWPSSMPPAGALSRPVHSLLGGAVRNRRNGCLSLLSIQGAGSGIGGRDFPEAMVARTEELIERHGFRVLKFKGGVLPPKVEFEVVRQLLKRFPDSPLRWDPNAALVGRDIHAGAPPPVR